MNKTSIFFLPLFFFAMQSCKERIANDSHVTIPTTSLSIAPDKDGIVRDIIPEDTVDYMQRTRQMVDASLGLQSLWNGFDKLEIRIWNEQSPWDYKGNLFVLRNQNEHWSALFYNYKYIFDASHKEIDTIQSELRVLKHPKSGWTGFANRLFDLNVLTLPDYRNIPSYELGMDEVGINIQIGLKNMYRSYNYPTPLTRVKEFPEAKRIVEIIKLIEHEFELYGF